MLVVYDADSNTGTDGNDEDQRLLELLADTLGYELVLVDDNLVTPDDTVDVAAIFISESVGSGNVVDKFKNVHLPIINAEVFTWDDMAWIDDTLPVDVDWGFANASEVQVAKTDHPILGGLSTFVVPVYGAPPEGEEVNQVGYGVPAASASVLALLPVGALHPNTNEPLDPSLNTRATLFTFEPGDELMDGTVAPARYVGFFAHRRGSENLSEVGEKLFLNAVLWATGRESEIRTIEFQQSMLVVYDADSNTGTDGNDEDQRLLELLADTLGYELVLVDDNLVTPDDTVDVAAIFISESVGSGNVVDKFKNVHLPIINAEVFTWDDMAWIDDTLPVDVDWGFANASEVAIVDTVDQAVPDHPILGGLALGEYTVYTDPPAGEEVNQVGYGVPAASASVLTLLPAGALHPNTNEPLDASLNTRATLFTFEPGDVLMDTTVAPARYVGFFAHRRGSENLSEVGEKLFLNAVAWATGRETEIRAITATPVAIEEESELPASFAIEGIYPNPFNPTATAALKVRDAGEYRVRIYDMLGRLVQERTLIVQAAGQVQVPFEMRLQASGLYLIQVEHRRTGQVATAQAMLVK